MKKQKKLKRDEAIRICGYCFLPTNCWRLTQPLDSEEPLPDHICEITARETCAAWARDNSRFPVKYQQGLKPVPKPDVQHIPLPDSRFAHIDPRSLKSGLIDVFEPGFKPLEYSGGYIQQPRKSGRIVFVLRQWVEVPVAITDEDKAGQHYVAALKYALPEIEKMTLEARQEIEKSASSETQVVGEASSVRHCSPDQIEEYRRLLVQAGLPATPGNARYVFHHLWGFCDLDTKNASPTPSRGVLVTSFGIRQAGIYRGEQSGQPLDAFMAAPGMIFGSGENGEYEEEIYDQCRKTMQTHRQFFKQGTGRIFSNSPRLFTASRHVGPPKDETIDADIKQLHLEGRIDDKAVLEAVREKHFKARWKKMEAELRLTSAQGVSPLDFSGAKSRCRDQVYSAVRRACVRIRKEKPTQ